MPRQSFSAVKAEKYERGQLLCKGLTAQSRHVGVRFPLPAPHQEIAKRDPHSIGGAEPPHLRTEFGETSTREHGRLNIAHDRAEGGSLIVHGVTLGLNEVDKDLRQSLIATSAAFSAAENEEEQVTQRTVIGLIVSEVLARSQWLAAKVRERAFDQRWKV